MLASFNQEEVRSFISDLDRRRGACNEGDFCSDLDLVLACHLDTCKNLLDTVRQWASSVFTGKVEMDPVVEAMFKAELRRTLCAARPHEEHAYEVVNECYRFERLEDLSLTLQEIERILKNWVTPQRSISPGPRVGLGQNGLVEAITRL